MSNQRTLLSGSTGIGHLCGRIPKKSIANTYPSPVGLGPLLRSARDTVPVTGTARAGFSYPICI